MKNKIYAIIYFALTINVGFVNAQNINQIALGKWSAYPPKSISVPTDPEQMAFDGENLWVVSPGSQSISKIQAKTGKKVGQYTLSPWPRGIAYDGTFLWITTENDDQVHKIDISNGFSEIGSYTVGAYPVEVIINKGYVWVMNYNGNSITQLTPNGKIVKTINVGLHPTSLAADVNNVYVTNENNTITKINSKGTVVDVFPTDPMPRGLSYDGSFLWYISDTNNSLIKISPASGNVLNKYSLDAGAGDTVFDGEDIWVTFGATGYIKRIRRTTGAVVEAIKGTVLGPSRVLFDGVNIWTTFNKQGIVMKF